MDIFPVLYKQGSDGKARQWQVFVTVHSPNKVELGTLAGIVGMKQAVRSVFITEGKNRGKKNETTPISQAQKEAKSLVAKKIREGYVEDIGAIAAAATSSRAMLAHKFQERGKDLPDLVNLQPKLDGVRTYITREGKDISYISRGNIEYRLPRYSELVRELLGSDPDLDSEIYLHGTPLRLISGALKKENELTSKLQLHIFDMPSKEPFFERYRELLRRYDYMKKNGKGQELIEAGIFIVNTTHPVPKDDYLKYHHAYVNRGYEGLMLRDPSAPYEYGFRSTSLQKYKEMKDAEFPIVDVVPDRTGHGKFICITPSGTKFTVRPKGRDSYRKAILKNKADYIGKMLTVRYQILHDGTDAPQFGVGIAVRDYE